MGLPLGRPAGRGRPIKLPLRTACRAKLGWLDEILCHGPNSGDAAPFQSQCDGEASCSILTASQPVAQSRIHAGLRRNRTWPGASDFIETGGAELRITAASLAARQIYYRPETAPWPGPLQRVVMHSHASTGALNQSPRLVTPLRLRLTEFGEAKRWQHLLRGRAAIAPAATATRMLLHGRWPLTGRRAAGSRTVAGARMIPR